MPWISKDVHVVLETELALAMFNRADQWDMDSGGRFDRRGASIVIWSASFTGDWKTAERQGQADFRWRTPGDGHATLYQIGWDPGEGGSEDIVWEALAVLGGPGRYALEEERTMDESDAPYQALLDECVTHAGDDLEAAVRYGMTVLFRNTRLGRWDYVIRAGMERKLRLALRDRWLGVDSVQRAIHDTLLTLIAERMPEGKAVGEAFTNEDLAALHGEAVARVHRARGSGN